MTALAPLSKVPTLSMLDLVAVREGGTVAEALQIALRTAQHADALGFARYWLAEHHNMAAVPARPPPCWWDTLPGARSASASARAA